MKKSSSLQSKDTGGQFPHYPFRPSILILDDDPIVTKVISQHLRANFPKAKISVSNQPIVQPDYNIYFIDNDFGGKRLATTLLEEVREYAPHALVVAMSSTLKMDELQTLVNRGCNVVYNKRHPQESIEAREVIEKYISILEERYFQKNEISFLNLLNSLKDLLKQWNRRLVKEEPKSFSREN